jgi:hypothetical protein
MNRLLLVALLVSGAGQAGGATFVVDNTDQSAFTPFRQCTAAPNDCSWYGALQRAEATPELDTIAFDIPSNDPGCGVAGCTVGLSTQTNVLLRPIVIDGLTQPGTQANTNPAPQGLNSVLAIEMAGNYTFQDSTTLRGVAVVSGNLTLGSAAFAAFPDIQRDYALESCHFGVPARGPTLQPGTQGTGSPNLRFTPVSNAGTALVQPTVLRVGGMLPAQRNWFATTLSDGGLSLAGSGNSASQGPVQVRIEGNLFGTDKSAATRYAEFPIKFSNIATANSQITIGGTAPAQRNLFVTTAGGGFYGIAVDTIGNGLSPEQAINPNIRVIGNYFGVTASGTPMQLQNTQFIRAQSIVVGGIGPGESNLFAVNSFPAIESRRNFGAVGRITILGNTSLGGIDSGAFHSGTLPNDTGDADAFAQNHPVIEGVSNLANNQLEIRYRVDSTSTNQPYPLLVEFYRALGNAPAVLLGRDSYTAAEATMEKTVVLTLPAGVAVLPSDVIIASATDASGATSVFSWTPMTLSFADNAPLLLNQPTPVRVRAVADGIFAPRGKVKIIFLEFSGSERFCMATLVPSGFGQSVGQCDLTFTLGVNPALELVARYALQDQPFASVTGQDLRVARTAAVIDGNIFCHGFEDNSTGTCRPLP